MGNSSPLHGLDQTATALGRVTQRLECLPYKEEVGSSNLSAPTSSFRAPVWAVPLKNSGYAVIDDADLALVNQFRWYLRESTRTKYACRIGDGIAMHRIILPLPKGLCVDHINHDGLDNRRANLRAATKQQNTRYSRKIFGHSKFKGVSPRQDPRKIKPKWHSRIYADGKSIHLGWFDSEIDAARAYDKKAKELFGVFAVLNFPEVAA